MAATARLWLTYDGEFRQTPPAELGNLLATPNQVKTHQDIVSLAPSAALSVQVDVSAGSGTALSIYGSIELVAMTPNGHSYIDGVFSWEPLTVQRREGWPLEAAAPWGSTGPSMSMRLLAEIAFRNPRCTIDTLLIRCPPRLFLPLTMPLFRQPSSPKVVAI